MGARVGARPRLPHVHELEDTGDLQEIHGRSTGDLREIHGRSTGDLREIACPMCMSWKNECWPVVPGSPKSTSPTK